LHQATVGIFTVSINCYI